jgi:hypothetical protein
MARGSNLNTLDIRFLRHVARWTTSRISVFKALALVDANPAAEPSQVVGG